MQGCASNVHCKIGMVVSGVCPHSHVVSSLKYIHFLLLLATCNTRVNLLRHIHAVQGHVYSFAKLSFRLTVQLCDDKFFRRCHSLQWMTFSGKSAGSTELREPSLFKRLSAGICSCRECTAFVSCLFFSTLSHTTLLISLHYAWEHFMWLW